MEIQASVFKARCLALLDDVARTGEAITILKRGRPVAQVVPVVPRQGQRPQDTLFGTVEVLGDVIEPVLPPDSWEAERHDT
jgi:prevent-host-death family protein